MADTEHFKGVKQVMENLSKEMGKLNGESTIQGMIRFAIEVRQTMDKQEPKVPVGKTGNLRASWFTVTSQGTGADVGKPRFKGKNASKEGSRHSEVKAASKSELNPKKPGLIMGFTASYAGYVHEDRRTGLKYKRPGAGAKFFESAVKNNMAKLMKILAENLKID